MSLPRPKTLGSTVAGTALVALLAVTVGPAGSPATELAEAAPRAAKCPPGKRGLACREARQRKQRKRKALRRANNKQKRPNVIVIMTDDQNQSDMAVMGVTLDRLGAHGTTFANSYVSNPLCCPSRATFITGQYAHNHGVISTELPNGYGALNHANTLPVWLKSAKYRTAMIGKYLNGYGIPDGIPERVGDAREIPPGWSEWAALTGGTDQKRYNFRLNENGKIFRYGKKKRDYVSDVLARKTYELLREWAPHPKPFFLWFNPSAPHGQNGVPFDSSRDPEPAPRYLGRYQLAAPRAPNFDEADVSDKPELVRNERPLTQNQINDIDRRYRGRLESLLSVDEQVGRIVNLLAKFKDLRNTYIIFTSDNGIQLGAHRLIFKAYLYEESTRVPLIIRGPGFPEGAVREQLVSNIDLAPTIAEITRVQPRLTMDGISLAAVANSTGPGVGGRDLLFESQLIGASGLRRGKWIFNEYGNGETELYDLENDPFQLQSQHANPNLESLEQSLDARLNQLRFCAGASCR